MSGRRAGLLVNGFLHDAAGVLPGPLLQYARAALHTAHHDHHQKQQQEQHHHPGQVLVDVEVLVHAWPRRASPDGPIGQTLALSLRQSSLISRWKTP